MDRFNLNSRQLTPMTHRPVVTFPTFVFESDYFLVFKLRQDFSQHVRAGDEGAARGNRGSVGVHDNVSKSDLLAGSRLDFLDGNCVSWTYPILLASRPNNCVRHDKVSNGKASKLPHAEKADKLFFVKRRNQGE
jgi:hypothetical protein